MANWSEVEAAAPELAARARATLDAHKHKVLATLRRDGSPRLSGIEATIVDGELWLGMMPGSRKALDLRRDPRFALHSAPVETDLAAGDARLGGRASEVTDPAAIEALLGATGHGEAAGDALLFRLELADASLITVRGEDLVVEAWRPGGPATRTTRR
jgi:hypothetical protein